MGADVLAIVPARIGSRGIPLKNYTPLAGLTPLHRAVMVADRCGYNIVVTADRPRLPGLSQAQWLEAYAPLHTDTCSMVDVVADVLARIPGPDDQIILLVQPTQPLREPQHLQQAVALLQARDSLEGCVISVKATESVDKLLGRIHWELVPIGDSLVERRQDARPTFKRDGTVYAWRRGSRLYAHPWIALDIPPHETCALDTPDDWAYAEWRLTTRG